MRLELPTKNIDSPVLLESAPENKLEASGNSKGESDILIPLPETEAVAPSGQGPLPQGSIQSPPLGAWAKKLDLSTVSISRSTVDQKMWPSLGASKSICSEPQVFQKPVAMEDAIRFPWAAKMSPSSRNLYRATEPEFLEDGTPKVTIPQHVLVQGLENQKEYVLGQFYRCSPPPGGLIFAVFNKLWGRTCKVTIRKLGECNYLFHIPDESTRTWVLQRGLWHVDDCLMFVAPWTPEPSLAIPEIKTIPVWVTLKKIPNILYSIPGISHIASGLGAPMATHKPRLDPILMGEAKILVEVELSKAFPPRIAAEDKRGFICMVDVEYAWLPSKCSRCGQLGHKVKRCLQTVSSVAATTTTKAPAMDDDIRSVITTSTPKKASISAQVDFPTQVDPVSAPATITTSTEVSSQVDDTTLAQVASVSSPATKSTSTEAPSAQVDLTLAQVASVSTPVTEVPPCDPITTFVSTTQPINQATIIAEEFIESPTLGAASSLSTDIIAQGNSTFHLESERLIERDLGSNKFASLALPEEEADSLDSDKESDETDFMTPSGKRILRDRPVKPSTKAKEMNWQITARGRGRAWLSLIFFSLKYIGAEDSI
ncbi:unnamed protein product [Microthlaspi erraticum]|uniref:CCHC-type domain-containing protein n=1 Tax=Microthlaspi erraticum TaxID=1685480 RepID=A0A6D2KWF3_9BRAS|nr:unnamed protein product [Microthlaspi erraticum]